MSTALKTSQDFIRALKAPSDPPFSDGPSKIQVANQAWNDHSLYVPNKNQVIADWLLTRLLKNKSKEEEWDPVTDADHWLLLSRIIDPIQHGGDSRRAEIWLVPLLNRVPVAPIIVSFLHELPSVSCAQRASVLTAFSRCLKVIWPLAIRKVNPDTLLDCFGALLGLFATEVDTVDTEQEGCWQVISPMIISSYRTALLNSTNKKKLYASFTDTHLPIWLRFINPGFNNPCYSSFSCDAYTAGVETLFCVDILRQLNDSTFDNVLFESLANINPSLVFPALPRLFLSFCSSVRKYRGNLFGQKQESTLTSSLDHVRLVGMKFYASCDFLLRSRENLWTEVWHTRTALLELVEHESLYNAAHTEYDRLLKETCNLAITDLQRADHTAHQLELLIRALCILTSIDYGIVSVSTPSILPIVAKIPGGTSSSFMFLKLLLDFHAKTRTLPDHLLNLFESLTPDHLKATNAQEIYQVIFSGSVFNPLHLNLLRKTISNFVTPGQCLELIQKTVEIIQRIWGQFQEIQRHLKAIKGDGIGEKQKLNDADHIVDPSEEITAVSFGFLCGLTSVIWTSVPANTVQDDVKTKIRECVEDFRTTVILPSIRGSKKVIKDDKRKTLDPWPWEVVLTAVLKLQYALASSKLGIEIIQNDKLQSRMAKLLRSDESLPELRLEVARLFLSQASLKRTSEFAPIFHSILNFLEVLPQKELVWKGRSCTLTRGQYGKEQAGVALLYMLADRWLPVVEDIANTAQQERFIRILLRATMSSSPECLSADTLSLGMIYRRTLRSAEFWELPNLRNVVLSYIDNETSILDQVDLHQALEALQLPAPATALHLVDLEKVMTHYETLLFAPPEYISRNARAALLRRGFSADVILTTLSLADQGDHLAQMRVTLRTFLSRVLSYPTFTEYNAIDDMTKYFINSRWIAATPGSDKIIDVTLQLIEINFSALIKLTEKGQDKELLKVLRFLATLNAFEVHGTLFDQTVIIRLLGLIATSTSSILDSRDISESVLTLVNLLTDKLGKRLSKVTLESSDLSNGLDTIVLLIEAWCRLLSLRRWLKNNDEIPEFGTAVVHMILSLEASMPGSKSMIQPCKSAILLLIAELQTCPPAHRTSRLQIIVLMYATFYRFCENLDDHKFDCTVLPTWDSMSAEDFSIVLDFSLELLSAPTIVLQELGSLVRLQGLLLAEAPEGTMKISQQHTTSCLKLFLDRSTFLRGPTRLRLKVLNFVSDTCNKRPATVRPGDVPYIWTILSKLLGGSETHDETTCRNLFHEIVDITSALVRLRRDLVLPTLPHLGMVLRQLMMTVRSPRPQLGGKQSKMVTDTFPPWISASQPLGSDDAKALARLFGTLTAKTVVRVYGTGSDVQKAESLARPFGKHAAYVMVAYIEAMNDSLCVISAEVRKELYPGLFELCGMLSDSDREALMLSALDSGGKTTMKMLWKEYEKQKYVGKG